MSAPRYERYKDSGVEWLGSIPDHWKISRLKGIAHVINGYPFDSKLFDPSIGMPLIRIRDLNRATPETFYRGDPVQNVMITSDDVLIGMDGDFNVGRWRGSGTALLNQRMCCVRGHTTEITRLLEYALPDPLKAINDITYSTTVKHLSSMDIEKTQFALPADFAEQRSLLLFLDRETAKIDALVEEQRRLIELLKEKRQAVISHAVTKGLDPSAPMKDSGVEWLGEVPAHWEVTSLKRFWSVTDCKHVTAEFVADGIPLASIREVQSRFVDLTEAKQTTCEMYEVLIEGGRNPQGGDLIFTRNATVGEVAEVASWHPAFAMGQDVCLLRKQQPQHSTAFLWFALRSAAVQQQLADLMIGSTFKRINVEEIRNLIIAMPPESEQTNMATQLDQSIPAIEGLQALASSAITLLQERRAALISAAVTGKIDVRGLVPTEAEAA